MEVGIIEGTDDVALTNTDVTEALLEVLGAWAAVHGFDDYTPRDLCQKYALVVEAHIEKMEPMLKSGKLPTNIVPRRKVN